jgi:predicted transcriptional regulator
LEAEVLACLGAVDSPKSASEVRAMLGGELAYTTVMTTLARLYRKGAIVRSPDGRAYRYALVGGPGGARSSVTGRQMLKLLDQETDRAGALTAFVAELGPEDERLLTELLERLADGTTEREGTEPC